MKDRAIVHLALAQTLIWAATFYSFPALLLRWENSFGWDRSELTGAVTLAILISACSSLFAGKLIDQGKGAIMMAACTFGGGTAVGLLALVAELWQFYLLWAFIGIMNGCCLYEPCFALITRARGADAKSGIILVTLIAGFAGTLSFPLAHHVSNHFGWQSAVMVYSAIAIFVATPLMYSGAYQVENNRTTKFVTTGQSAKRLSIIGNYRFWLLAIGFSLGAVIHGVTLHHLLPILEVRKFSPEHAVLAAALIGPMQVVGRLVIFSVERHVSLQFIAISCFSAMGLASITLLFTSGGVGLLIGFVVCFGSAYGVVSIIRPLIAREILGEQDFGMKAGGLAAIYLIGGASAPFLGSLVWEIGGYDLVLKGLVGLAVVGLTLYLISHAGIKSSDVQI